MCKYDVKRIISKSNKEVIFRNLEPADSEKYINFSEVIASETTHTLHYPSECLSIDSINEKLKSSMKSPFQLELGGFYNDILVAHLSLFKPKPIILTRVMWVNLE